MFKGIEKIKISVKICKVMFVLFNKFGNILNK